jgi:uncharacterized tellurite resistance protein B-like protein
MSGLIAMSAASAPVLADITQYPWQRRRDYLLLVAAVAASDAELHPDELRLLNRWVEQFRLPPKSREAVLAVAEHRPVDFRPIEKRLAGTDLVCSLVLDMMAMAMADGVLMDDEILLLQGVAEALGVDPIQFNILIEFVHSAHQAAQLSNPEPLYEHNIEAAFALLKKHGVRLFNHTLLCVSNPRYDEELKARWAKFPESAGHG